MMETVVGAVIGAVIGAATTLLIATIGGIIWIVRKFGEMNRDLSVLKEIVNSRFSSLEQRLTHLENLSLYKSTARHRDTEQPVAVKGIEIRFIEEKSNE